MLDDLKYYYKKRDLKEKYKLHTGKKLNINNPQSYNEKMQWLKINYRNYRCVLCADKELVKKYLRKKGYSKYIPKTLAVFQKVEDIDYNLLPKKFVLKTTHGSGFVVLCEDKEYFDIQEANKKLESWLKFKYGRYNYEWFYDVLKPRIIVEEFLEDSTEKRLVDYKVMCFNGKCKLIFTVSERERKHKMYVDFYDEKWNRMDFTRLYRRSENGISKPALLHEMIEVSENISKEFPFLRVDFFVIRDKLYIGELTFIPGSGWEPFRPDKWDYIYGKDLILPSKKECRQQKRDYIRFLLLCIARGKYWI